MNRLLACIIIFFCNLETAFANHNNTDENSFSEAEDIADTVIEKPERSIFDLLFNNDEDAENIAKYDDKKTDDTGELILEVKKDGAFHHNTLIRVLDKTIGVFYDFSLEKGVQKDLKGISVKSYSCWKSAEKGLKPDARALLEVTNNEANNHDRVFYGWKFATFPAMSYIKHPKYELIVVDCH